MRLEGTSSPRKNVGAGGFAVRCAQSRGEWPGSRRTFLDGRLEGARVEIEGAREALEGLRELVGGARRVDAAEGGGRRVVDGLGGTLNVGGFAIGCGDGGMSGADDCSDLFSVLGDGGAGGSIFVLNEGPDDAFSASTPDVLGGCSAVCAVALSPSSSVNVGISRASCFMSSFSPSLCEIATAFLGTSSPVHNGKIWGLAEILYL